MVLDAGYIPLEKLFEAALLNVEEINAARSAYGKALYAAGRPYGHFGEAINACVSQKPVLRRNLQQAWDYTTYSPSGLSLASLP